tara:strand:+ start:2123 stop:2374 length:252 start_codon:yes stop_codon:yes gene_type:complete
MENRIDTTEAVRDLFDAIGGGYRPAAEILDISHTTLWGTITRNRPPVSLDTLAKLASRAKEEAGINLEFSVKPGQEFEYKITK